MLLSPCPAASPEITLPAGLLLVSNTGPHGLITYCNAALIEASGYQQDELVGQPYTLLHHSDMPPEVLRDLHATLEAGQIWSAVVLHRHKNGQACWVRTAAAPVSELRRQAGHVIAHARPRPDDLRTARKLYGAMRQGSAIWRAAAERSAGWGITPLALELAGVSGC